MRSAARRLLAPSVRARSLAAAGAVGLAVVLGIGVIPATAAAESYGAFSDSLAPADPVDPDRVAVELGVQLSTSQAGAVTGLQFYRGPAQHNSYTGTLWSGEGDELATVSFPASTTVGWQTAQLREPVTVAAGASIVASYYAADGAYPVTERAFTSAYVNNDFTVPRGGGVYKYGESGFPTGSWRESNYLVDVVFAPADGTAEPSPEPTVSPTPPPPPTPTPTPRPTPTPTATPTPSPSPSPGPSDPPGDPAVLDLPRIPWEGGSDYWTQFPDAERWSDPSFFPIGVWWGNVSSDAEAQWDKAHGIKFHGDVGRHRLLPLGGQRPILARRQAERHVR